MAHGSATQTGSQPGEDHPRSDGDRTYPLGS